MPTEGGVDVEGGPEGGPEGGWEGNPVDTGPTDPTLMVIHLLDVTDVQVKITNVPDGLLLELVGRRA